MNRDELRRLAQGRIDCPGDSVVFGDAYSRAANPDTILELLDTVDGLVEALMAFRMNGPDDCWCGVAINDPRLRGVHTRACQAAQKATAKAKERP